MNLQLLLILNLHKYYWTGITYYKGPDDTLEFPPLIGVVGLLDKGVPRAVNVPTEPVCQELGSFIYTTQKKLRTTF